MQLVLLGLNTNSFTGIVESELSRGVSLGSTLAEQDRRDIVHVRSHCPEDTCPLDLLQNRNIVNRFSLELHHVVAIAACLLFERWKTPTPFLIKNSAHLRAIGKLVQSAGRRNEGRTCMPS